MSSINIALTGKRTEDQAPRRRLQLARAFDTGPAAVLVGLIAISVFFQAQNSHFLSSRNISNLILQMSVVGILGVGVVLVMIAGEIDLSLGSITGMSAATLGVLLTLHHWSAWTAVLAAVVVGVGAGAVQGLATVYLAVPSFLVTLGGLLAWSGVQLALVGDQGELPINDTSVQAIANEYLSDSVAWAVFVAVVTCLVGVEMVRGRAAEREAQPAQWPLRAGRVAAVALSGAAAVAYLNRYFGVPYLLVILLALMLTLGWITQSTGFGRHLYAVGGNREAARRAGISVRGVRIAVLTLSGALAGIAGVVSASRLYSVSAGTGGGTLLLEAIAAAVIGGTSLFGGRGRAYQALLGALVITSIENGLDLLGRSAATKNVATGVILVLAVAFDALRRQHRNLDT